MTFNWKSFCNKYHVEYVEKGPNVGRGNINISCPFCSEDPSHHMGLNLKNQFWGCWRSRSHRGKRPQRLIVRLLGCTYSQADELVGSSVSRDLGEFRESIERLKGSSKKNKADRHLQMPEEFVPIENKGVTKKFFGYLVRRGFRKKDVPKLVKKYDLRCATDGRWRNRIIIPVTMPQGLVTWTSRTISKHDELRYLSLTNNPEKAKKRGDPPAILNIKDTILWYQMLLNDGGEALYLVEGPFDSLKLDFYGASVGVRSTCLFSTDLRETQLALLSDIATRFVDKILLLDPGQHTHSMELLNDLYHLGFELGELPNRAEDPGDMTQREIEQL